MATDRVSDNRLRTVLAVHKATGVTPAPDDEVAAAFSELLALREAVAGVLAHRVGDLPVKGWLKDTDASRKALGNLALLTKETAP